MRALLSASTLLCLVLLLEASPASAQADDDEDTRRRGTTELYAFVEGGYGLVYVDDQPGPALGAGERPADRLVLRLGVGLGHVELRRWATPSIGGRLALSIGGVRGQYRATSDREVVASQPSPLFIAGASLGPIAGGRYVVLSAAPQYLFIRAKDYPETLGDFSLSGGSFNALGIEARIAASLPRGVELGLIGRFAKILGRDTFLSFGVAVLFRLFRHDPGASNPSTPCEGADHETPFRQLEEPARPGSSGRPC